MGLGDFIEDIGDAAQGVVRGAAGVAKGVGYAALFPEKAIPAAAKTIGAAAQGVGFLASHPGYIDDAAKAIFKEQMTWENVGETALMALATAGTAALVGKGAKVLSSTAKVAEDIGDVGKAAKTTGRVGKFYDAAMQKPTMQIRSARKALGMPEAGYIGQARTAIGEKIAGGSAELTQGGGVVRQLMNPATRNVEGVGQGLRSSFGRSVQGSPTAPHEALGGFAKGKWRLGQAQKWQTRQAVTREIGQAEHEVYDVMGGPQAIADRARAEAAGMARDRMGGGGEQEEEMPKQSQPPPTFDPFAPDLIQPEPQATTLRSGIGVPKMPSQSQYGPKTNHVPGRGQQILGAGQQIGQSIWSSGTSSLRKGVTKGPGFWQGRSELGGINSSFDWRDMSRPAIARVTPKTKKAKSTTKGGREAPKQSVFGPERQANTYNFVFPGAPNPPAPARGLGTGVRGAIGQGENEAEWGGGGRRALGQHILDVESWEPGHLEKAPFTMEPPKMLSAGGEAVPTSDTARRRAGMGSWGQSRIGEELVQPTIPETETAAGQTDWPTHVGY
jgi:hypothetical protein